MASSSPASKVVPDFEWSSESRPEGSGPPSGAVAAPATVPAASVTEVLPKPVRRSFTKEYERRIVREDAE